MIAVDTNILVYAHRKDSSWHQPARNVLKNLAQGTIPWAIPWPCIHEFLAIITHPRIYSPPTTLAQASAQVDGWLGSPSLVLIGESDDHWSRLSAIMEQGQVQGPQVHDARIAAICMAHGINELLSADRDFSRFPGLSPHNPLVA